MNWNTENRKRNIRNTLQTKTHSIYAVGRTETETEETVEIYYARRSTETETEETVETYYEGRNTETETKQTETHYFERKAH